MGNLLRRSLGSVIAHGIASGPSELGAAPTSLPLLLTMGLLSCRALAIAPPDRFKTRSASCSGAGSAAVHQSMVARAADGERRSTARTVPDTYCLDGTAVGALALAGRRRHCGRHLLLHTACAFPTAPSRPRLTIASINLSLVPMSSDNGDGIDDADGKIDLDCQTASDLRGRSHLTKPRGPNSCCHCQEKRCRLGLSSASFAGAAGTRQRRRRRGKSAT
jgi:hypothetical protein